MINVKLCVPVVTSSINDDIEFLENTKQRFKRTIYWKEYRSEITTKKEQFRLFDLSNIKEH